VAGLWLAWPMPERTRGATAQDAVACAAIVAGLPDYFTDDVPEKARLDLRDHGGWVI
jgi:hypothetical protein